MTFEILICLPVPCPVRVNQNGFVAYRQSPQKVWANTALIVAAGIHHDHLSLAVDGDVILVAGEIDRSNVDRFGQPTYRVERMNGPLKSKDHISFVSENVMLYPNFTAIQNLEYFTRLGGKTHYPRDKYREVLLRVGLDEGAHHKRLKGFSKGMRQKCGIAIAILKDATAILLDEPTSGLDPKAGFEFIQLLASLRGEGKAILMSTHDIFRAKEIADVVGIMNRGKLVMQRPANDLIGEDLEKLYMENMAGYVEQAA